MNRIGNVVRTILEQIVTRVGHRVEHVEVQPTYFAQPELSELLLIERQLQRDLFDRQSRIAQSGDALVDHVATAKSTANTPRSRL